MSLLRYVNPLQGTASTGSLSTGNSLPLVALPFGMAHWTLQTDKNRGWHFHPGSPKLQGIRCTHQPSPWMGDYGAFTILPQAGKRYTSASRRATAYRIDKAIIKPNHMSVKLAASGLQIEMAPTERCAIFRFRFPEGIDSRIVIDGAKGETFFSVKPDNRTIVGYTRGSSGGVPEGFACHFVAVLSASIESWNTFQGDDVGPANESKTGDELGVCLELGVAGGKPVEMRLATSFISAEHAEKNLRREIADASLETLAQQGAEVWEKSLGQIQVEEEDETKLRTFYTCLYRTKLFPRIWHELDDSGNPIHYSPYDGQIHPGVLYADTGTWDTYRTQFPLLSLLEPERYADILKGFINAYRESGWFPQWPSPGHRVCMPGTHLDAVIADAAVKGIPGVDLETALEGMLKHADGPADVVGAGRDGIEDYLREGYCTIDVRGSVARTLDYAYDDWCIAQVAAKLGKKDVADRLLGRALNYKKIYDPSVGFMRGRNSDGAWREPFDVYEWGGPYVEGGPWQSTWAVQHDPAGLMALMGGENAFAAKLDEMLATPPYFNIGDYGFEIHEMTEMAVADFGQYAHSNQPVHHVLFLYHAAGKPWRAQKEVRRVMDELYSPDGFSGDEDNGEMAAWYVLNALGIFQFCPGHPSWCLSSPLFKKATVHLPNGRDLVVEAPENAREKVYVDSVSLSGEALESTVVDHARLAEGGTLHFQMSENPATKDVPVSQRPYSMSPY